MDSQRAAHHQATLMLRTIQTASGSGSTAAVLRGSRKRIRNPHLDTRHLHPATERAEPSFRHLIHAVQETTPIPRGSSKGAGERASAQDLQEGFSGVS